MTTDTIPVVAASDVPTATAAQMAEVDLVASREFGIALEALMESAARQIARVVRHWSDGTAAGRDVVAIAGSGNNGGDALAALRWLHGWGAGIRAVLAVPPQRMRPLAGRQLASLVAMGAEVIDASADAVAAREVILHCDLLLDGLLGYSAHDAPRAPFADVIRMTHDTRATIVAVDLPSGLGADSGDVPGDAVHANLTVTLALPKPGLAQRRHVGTLFLADIGIPPQAFARAGIDTTSVFKRGDLLRIAPR